MNIQNPTFVFDSYTVGSKKVDFVYYYKDQDANEIGRFVETYTLPADLDASDPTIQYILKMYHLLAGISYYKSLLGKVETAYELSESEATYLNDIYDNGLGEYSFVNKLTQLIRPFNATLNTTDRTPVSLETAGAILGIGGGKDSIVTAEINKAIKLDTIVLGVSTRAHHGQAGAVMNVTGLPQTEIGRYVDVDSLVGFNQKYQGMNGHIPLSVLLAWLGTLLAYTTNKRYIMMGNEAATSDGNVEWNGRVVNHQWAKSYEAEKLTQDFIHSHISPDLWYVSPIRPYGSLAVLELFVKLGQDYYNDFTSCNMVLRIDPASRPNGRWCTRCAKCLSTWLLLTPWLSIEQLTGIFGRNLFDDPSLRITLDALLGLSGHKPLDCVGTTEELRAVTRLFLDSPHATTSYAILEGLTSASIPGPSIQELTNDRSPANIPSELSEMYESFVSSQLSA
jgi:hypothetical protein